jgi:hypothetical protein
MQPSPYTLATARCFGGTENLPPVHGYHYPESTVAPPLPLGNAAAHRQLALTQPRLAPWSPLLRPLRLHKVLSTAPQQKVSIVRMAVRST